MLIRIKKFKYRKMFKHLPWIDFVNKGFTITTRGFKEVWDIIRVQRSEIELFMHGKEGLLRRGVFGFFKHGEWNSILNMPDPIKYSVHLFGKWFEIKRR